MNTVQDLRKMLGEVLIDLRDENSMMDAKKANAVSNLAGKMIASATAQLKQCAQRNEEPNIHFLKEDQRKNK
jgi:hypothetical protein